MSNQSLGEVVEHMHREGYLLIILFFGVGAFLIWWKASHFEKKYPVTAGSCVELVDRIWKQLPIQPTSLEQEDLDRCDEGRPVAGRYP
jgi:hypothetical protein